MNQNDQTSQPTPLDYATPSKRPGNPVLGVVVAVLAVGAGTLGAMMLFFAIPVLVAVITSSPRRDFAGDFFRVVVFLLIGIVALYASIRGCRAVRGIIAGEMPNAGRWPADR